MRGARYSLITFVSDATDEETVDEMFRARCQRELQHAERANALFGSLPIADLLPQPPAPQPIPRWVIYVGVFVAGVGFLWVLLPR